MTTRLRAVDEAFIADVQAHLEPEPDDDGTVSAVELVALSGLTYRQVDYAVATGRLRPLARRHERSGVVRRFPAVEVVVATTMRRLLDADVGLRTAHDAARAHAAAPEDLVPIGPGLALIITDDDEREPTP